MTFKEFAELYFFGGIITCIIGLYRFITKRQTAEPQPLDALTWFIFWWFYLGYLIPMLFIKYKKKIF